MIFNRLYRKDISMTENGKNICHRIIKIIYKLNQLIIITLQEKKKKTQIWILKLLLIIQEIIYYLTESIFFSLVEFFYKCINWEKKAQRINIKLLRSFSFRPQIKKL